MTRPDLLLALLGLVLGFAGLIRLAFQRYRARRINRDYTELFRSLSMHWAKDPQVPYHCCACKVCVGARESQICSSQPKEKRP